MLLAELINGLWHGSNKQLCFVTLLAYCLMFLTCIKNGSAYQLSKLVLAPVRPSATRMRSIICIAHEHYIEHLSNFCYNCIEENYIVINIVLSPNPTLYHFMDSILLWLSTSVSQILQSINLLWFSHRFCRQCILAPISNSLEKWISLNMSHYSVPAPASFCQSPERIYRGIDQPLATMLELGLAEICETPAQCLIL